MNSAATDAARESTYVHNVTVNDSRTLDTVLTEITRTEQVQENGTTVTRPVYNREHTWNITIASGYEATISNRYRGIRCNFHLKGEGSDKAKIYISKNVIAQTGRGDSILDLLGESTSARIEVILENLEFMPVGAVAGTAFISSPATDFTKTTHLIKVYFASKVILYKLKSALENGVISNVDLRTCDGITVSKCEFINNNGVMSGNLDGSIMMVRGTMHDVLIDGNTFTKYGNDEMLWIAGNPVPDPSMSAYVPDTEKERTVRRNIRVTNNTFHYRRPTVSPTSSTLRPSSTMGVMIAFDSFNDTYWENVLFAYNNILAEDLVRRIVWVERAHNALEFKNFRFIGNKIRHDYTYTTDDAWAIDFEMTGNGTHQPKEAIEVAHNEIQIAETMGPSNTGRLCFKLQGINMNVHDNVIDAKDFKVMNPYFYQPTGVTVCAMDGGPSDFSFVRNQCYNTGGVARIRNVNSPDAVRLFIAENYIEGASKILFTAAQEAYVRIENNFFRSTSYELILENAPSTGAIWASGNVWNTVKPTPTSSNSVVIFAGYTEETSWNLSRATFINNVVTGERILGPITFPEADTTVVAGNTVNPT